MHAPAVPRSQQVVILRSISSTSWASSHSFDHLAPRNVFSVRQLMASAAPEGSLRSQLPSLQEPQLTHPPQPQSPVYVHAAHTVRAVHAAAGTSIGCLHTDQRAFWECLNTTHIAMYHCSGALACSLMHTRRRTTCVANHTILHMHLFKAIESAHVQTCWSGCRCAFAARSTSSTPTASTPALYLNSRSSAYQTNNMCAGAWGTLV